APGGGGGGGGGGAGSGLIPGVSDHPVHPSGVVIPQIALGAPPGWLQARKRLRLSTTQTGLSDPSRSTVITMVVSTPPATSSTATSSTPARRRDPTGTGAGKRTLPVPRLTPSETPRTSTTWGRKR